MDLIKPQVGIRLLFMTHKNIFTSLEQPSHILEKKKFSFTHAHQIHIEKFASMF